MNRMAVFCFSLGLTGLPPFSARADLSFHLVVDGDIDGGPRAQEVQRLIAQELVQTGWRAQDKLPDVELTLELVRQPSMWCGQLSVAWWDQPAALASTHCAPSRLNMTKTETLAPTKAEVLSRIIQPIVVNLRAQEDSRWSLVIDGAEHTSKPVHVQVGGRDATARLRWSGAEARLSVAGGARPRVAYGPCSQEVGRDDGAVDLARLARARQVALSWLHDGVAVAELVVRPKQPFELSLAATNRGPGQLVSLPCAGDIEVTLDAVGYTATLVSTEPGSRWTWNVTTNLSEGVIEAGVRTQSTNDAGSATLKLPFRVPWWQQSWTWLIGGLGALATLLTAVTQIAAGLRKLWSRQESAED